MAPEKVLYLLVSREKSLHPSFGSTFYGTIRPYPDRFYVVRGVSDQIVENLEPEVLSSFKKPFYPVFPVCCEFEQELLFVAPVSDVPDMVGKKISVRSLRRCVIGPERRIALNGRFWGQK
jgi:hypothetical protein